MNKKYSEDEDALIVGEIQSFLQEKRTALKTIRIGTAVIVAVISLIGYLIATFRSHAIIQARDWMGILAALSVILLGVVIYLFIIPPIRIRRIDHKILKLKRKRSEIVNLINQ
jgi:membrane protein YdbS with pleckstrin-like domain